MKVMEVTAVFRRLLVVAFFLGGSISRAEVTYPLVVPGYTIEFPRDEGAHPQFRTEWWYVTGWVEDTAGAPLGFQVTFFRNRPGLAEGNPSRFAPQQLMFAHAALSDLQTGKLLHTQKSARAGFGLAQSAQGRLDVAIDDWQLQALNESGTYHAVVSTKDFELNLDLATTQPPLLQGVAGFSQKGPDVRSSSYYYSMPQLRVSGQVRTQEGVREVHGVAWLDHEWSSSLMDEQAQGWDWLGLNLDDGGALMVFRMRDAKGEPHWAAAKRRKASGASYELISYAREALEWKVLRTWRSPHTGVEYPVEWQLRVGDDTLVLRPLMDDQENDSRGSTGTIYYEGAVRAFDSTGHTIGRGYLELTGYGSRMKL